MLQFFYIGVFLWKKKAIQFQTDGCAILADQLINLLWSKDCNETTLNKCSEILDLHLPEIDANRYLFFKGLIATKRIIIKNH